MLVGRSIARVEDRAILSGQAAFIDAMHAPAELHMRVVRSPIAHGRLASIDIAAGLRGRGVVDILIGADTRHLPPIGIRGASDPALDAYLQPVLAQEYVRYAGEPVAVVLAETAALAEDAARLVRPQIEPLPARTNARAPDQAFRYGEANGPTTECARIQKDYGDVDTALAQAPHCLDIVCEVGRQTAVPMETRGLLAIPDPQGKGLELHGAAKIVHANRDALAAILGLEREVIVLREGHVGGGFGVRGELYPEDVLACFAALRTGRPVKWLEDRDEHLVAINQARGQVLALRAGFDDDGVIVALLAEILVDQGAYLRTAGTKIADFTCAFLPGPYRIPAYRADAVVSLTHKTPAGTYRAPGRFEATFAMERVIDAVARHRGLDPIAVRRRNLITKDQIPFRRPMRSVGKALNYDSGDYDGALSAGLDFAGYAQMSAAAARRRSAGERVGVGVAMFVEKSGGVLRETAGIELAADGTFVISTGASALGQGLETVLSQIAADGLGVGLDCLRVHHGQSDGVSESAGTYGSRSTVMAGSAVEGAASALRQRLTEVAAGIWQAPLGDIDVTPTGLACSDGRHMGFAEVASATAADPSLPILKLEHTFSAEDLNFPYGLHVAQVRVDASYIVSVERYVIAYDIGRAINPLLVRGQLIGGAVQGIGASLIEEIRHAADGRPLTRSFGDYVTPRAGDVPRFDVLLLENAPSPTNPLGAKGGGEGGINAAGAAMAAAVEDAFGGTITPLRLPMSPRYLFNLHMTPDASPLQKGDYT